jgi:hypothetical protein
MISMRVLKSVNFSYVTKEDRILAAVNPGGPDAWSCWLTRRLTLALLDRTPEYLANTSPLMRQAPTEVRQELATFERESAIASTAKLMSKTPDAVLKISEDAAELAEGLTITLIQSGSYRVELRAQSGGSASGPLTRAELQRFLQLLQNEVDSAGWSNKPAGPVAETIVSRLVRH